MPSACANSHLRRFQHSLYKASKWVILCLSTAYLKTGFSQMFLGFRADFVVPILLGRSLSCSLLFAHAKLGLARPEAGVDPTKTSQAGEQFSNSKLELYNPRLGLYNPSFGLHNPSHELKKRWEIRQVYVSASPRIGRGKERFPRAIPNAAMGKRIKKPAHSLRAGRPSADFDSVINSL